MLVELNGEQVVDRTDFMNVPWNVYDGSSTMYDIDRPITGKVSIKCPPNSKTWIGGINITLDETLHFLDIFTTSELRKIEINVGCPTWIDSDVEYEFTINLDQVSDRYKGKWHDSYNGETFGLRHCLICTIIRPWYVIFNEPVYSALKMYEIHNKIDEIDNTPVPINVYEVASICEAILPTVWVQPGQSLRFELKITGATKPIDFAQFLFFRSEYIEEQSDDSIIGRFKLCGPDVPDTTQDPATFGMNNTMNILKRIDEGDNEPRPSDGILSGSHMEIEIHFDPCLAPSFDTSTEGLKSKYDESNPSENAAAHKDTVAVRYYLRLFLIDSDGDAFWNTAELFFYKTTKPDVVRATPGSSGRTSVSNEV